MSESIKVHQLFEYGTNEPFCVNNIGKNINIENNTLLDHWHSEIEIVYTFKGHAKHYVDGVCYEAVPGSILIINSESIHNIVPDEDAYEEARVVAVVLIVSYKFMEHILPNIGQLRFVNGKNINMNEITSIMTQISKYADKNKENYDYLLIKGLVYQLFYWLSKDGLEERNFVLSISNQKNIERLRGVIQYVHEHYKEPITQQLVAKKFYFSKEYFSRFFKKKTGMTFKEYLTKYRIHKAKEELLKTDKTILEVGMDNGFSDSRAFINAFKSFYQITPLQYRLEFEKQKIVQ
jgi:AraC-type DNA-binding domain-containing proteins